MHSLTPAHDVLKGAVLQQSSISRSGIPHASPLGKSGRYGVERHTKAGSILFLLALLVPLIVAERWVLAEESAVPSEHPWPPSYVIIDLGTLGGWSSVGLGINDLGQVVGGADTLEGVRHAYVWEAGVMTDLGTLPGLAHAEARDINNFDQIVGVSLNSIHEPPHGFSWDNGVITDVGHLGGGETYVTALNEHGQVVGNSRTAELIYYEGFLWEGGVMEPIPSTLGGIGSSARDINGEGQIVGSASTGGAPGGAFLWQDGAMMNLGTLGGQSSAAFAVNDRGQVVGCSERAPGGDRVYHACVWDADSVTDLGALGGFASSTAEGINNAGMVIGYHDLFQGFIYDPEKGIEAPRDLLPPDDARRTLSIDIPALNNAGQMVGAASFPSGRLAFLMTPIDTDFDNDEDVDLEDHRALQICMTGPRSSYPNECKPRDIDRDGDIDMMDFRVIQWVFGTD